MTGKDLLFSLSEIPDELLDLTEEQNAPSVSLRRLIWCAAIILLSLALLGCAIVYGFRMQDLKMGTLSNSIPAKTYDDGSQSQAKTLDLDLISLSGAPGSPAYQAAQEWHAFWLSYDPDFAIRSSFQGSWPDFGEEYRRYNIYTQEMLDKFQEILQHYGLRENGPSQTYYGQRLTGCFPEVDFYLSSGNYYACGNWDLTFRLPMDSLGELWGSLNYRRKDAFIGDTLPLGDGHDWIQEPIAVSSGGEILAIYAPSSPSTHLLCDLGDSTVTVTIFTDTQHKIDEEGISYATDWVVLSREQIAQIIRQLESSFFDTKFWESSTTP